MRTLRPLSALAGALAAGLLLTACSGGGDSGPKAEDSPLSQYLSAVWGGDLSQEEQERRWAEQNAKTEEIVAQCMTEQGFEYIPNTNTGSISTATEHEWNPDSRDWVSQYGYGAINYPGRDDAPIENPGEEWVDPNADYIQSLSASEQQAFYDALHGAPMTEEEMAEDTGGEWDWTQSGCYGLAYNEQQGEDPMQSDEFQPLMEAINELYSSTMESPELADLHAQWASCMADAGEPGFSRQEDAQNSIYDELNKLYEDNPEGDIDESATEAIGEREVELALIDLDCREEVDFRGTQLDLQFAAEEQFIADNKAELDALKAAAEQGR